MESLECVEISMRLSYFVFCCTVLGNFYLFTLNSSHEMTSRQPNREVCVEQYLCMYWINDTLRVFLLFYHSN